MLTLLIGYSLFINLAGLVMMFLDKQKAKRGSYRIPEVDLWEIALIGGALGATLGMELFRHKTKHSRFKFGFPLLAVLQVVGYFYIASFLG